MLGAHPHDGGVVVRALRPAASAVTALIDGQPRRRAAADPSRRRVRGRASRTRKLPLHYQLEVDYGDAGKFTIDDPYAFLPTIGELDQHLIGEGRHEELYDRLGAHVREIDSTRAS